MSKDTILVKYRGAIQPDGSQPAIIDRYDIEYSTDGMSIDETGAVSISKGNRVVAIYKDYIWAKR